MKERKLKTETFVGKETFRAKKLKGLALIKQIRAKITSLKYGYIADKEFDELEDLVGKIK